jgi:hypothetical protein
LVPKSACIFIPVHNYLSYKFSVKNVVKQL